MGWSNSNTSSGGGGGTTINPTNDRVPVRQNGTTFVDAQIISNIASTPYSLQLLIPIITIALIGKIELLMIQTHYLFKKLV